MITYQLPRKIRYVPGSAIFEATFNAPTIGKYDFDSNTQIFVPKLLNNSVYLIDSFSVAGNIASEDFLTAIDTVPLLSLQKTLDNENIFDNPIPIQNFSTDRQIVHFFKTGLNNCGLQGKISGVLNQVAPFVGIGTIKLSVTFSLHVIDDSDFEKTFRKES